MILRLCGIGLICALLSVFLSEMGFKSVRLLGFLCLAVMFAMIGDYTSKLLSEITELANANRLSEAAGIAVKAVGLGYVVGFTSDACAELGESRIASMVSLGGRIAIFGLILPYFEKTVQLGIELLK